MTLLKELWEVHGRLIDTWVVYKGFRESLIDRLNTFICTSLYGAIKELNSERSGGSENKPTKISRNDNRKINRNSRKRYSYVRCQELFDECPKRLADAVVNNDRTCLEPARQPPEAAEVRRLYEEFWGQAGPLNAPIPGCRASELSLNEMFPPIIVEDVADRISRMSKKSAAWPDGFQKGHLMISGLPAILAKLFNILCYSSVVP